MSKMKCKLLPLLICFILATGAAADDFIIPWEKIDDWQWGSELPAWNFSAMSGKVAINRGKWAGAEDLSANIYGGWTDEGLLFFAQVTDDDICDPVPDTELWLGDAVEFYITSPTDSNYAVGNRLQVIVAAPDKNGVCRTAFYADDTAEAKKHFKVSGELTENGYTVTAFFPWEALGGNAREMIMTDGFRFNMFIDDYQKAIMSLNGRQDLNAVKTASPVLTLASCEPANNVYWDMTLRSDMSSETVILNKGDIFEFDAGNSCKVILTDANGNAIVEKDFADGRISFAASDFDYAKMQVLFVENGSYFLMAEKPIIVIDNVLLQQKITQNENIAQCITALGIINSVDCLRSASGADDVPDELLWRSRQLAGEDIADAPGILRYLNLMGDPSGLVQVGIARGWQRNRYTADAYKYASFTAQWGGIPIVYADICIYEDAGTARAVVDSCRHLRHEIPMEINGADIVYAGRGLTMAGALVTDADPEYLVSVVDPAAPANISRLTPEDAVEYASAAGFVVRKGANPEHIGYLEAAGLPELTEEAAAAANAPVIYVGREGFDVAWANKSYRNPMYGVPDDTVWAARDNVVVRTSCSIPELAQEVIAAIFADKPVTAETVDRWRKMRLEAMGGDIPGLREQGRLVRTGDVHTHTFYSDGGSTPGTLLAEAVAGGMDFLIITDHDSVEGAVKLSRVMEISGFDFPLIWGSEVTASNAYHLNVFPITEPFVRDKMNYGEIIESARRQGAVVMLNHPMTYGINLRDFWYNSMENSGIDAVERDMSQLETWRSNGYEGVFLGSTDTHYGIFGHGERSVFLMDKVTGEDIAKAVIAGECAMIAPDLPELVYGNSDVVNAVRAALGDDALPEYHNSRLLDYLENFNSTVFIYNSPTGNDSNFSWCWDGDPEEIITAIPAR